MTLPHPLSPMGLDLIGAENALAYYCSVKEGPPEWERRDIFLALKPETIAADIRGMGVDRAGALLYATRNGDSLEESAALVGALLAIYDAGMRPLLLTQQKGS
jgi:hypothetical protein